MLQQLCGLTLDPFDGITQSPWLMATQPFENDSILISQQLSVLVFPGIALQAKALTYPLGQPRAIGSRGASNRQQQLCQLAWFGLFTQSVQTGADLSFLELTEVGLNLLKQRADRLR